MTATRVIGIDPGPMTGMVVLRFDELAVLSPEVLQCTHSLVLPVIRGMEQGRDGGAELAVEDFVVRGRANRAQTVTRDLVADLRHRYPWAVFRAASEVKPWASDERLAAAGLLDATAGMRHARDAARHALFAAVRDHRLPDPLSRRGGAR